MVLTKSRLRATALALVFVLGGGLMATSCNAVQLHPFLTCVRRHESDRGGRWPYVGGYRAQNPVSTASGAYQFLNSSWRVLSVRAGYPGFAAAKHAPASVQDQVAYWTYRHIGKSPWRGTGC